MRSTLKRSMNSARKSLIGVCLIIPSLIAALVYWRWSWKNLFSRPSSSARGQNVNKRSIQGADSGERDTRRVRQVEAEVAVPDRLVGYVIGRRGNRIRQIEEESGAKLRIKERIGSDVKIVAIRGRPECVQSAEKAVQLTVDQKTLEEKDQKKIKVLIPNHAVGRLIGRKGTNIRSIQHQSGASISVEDSEVDGQRQCIITGIEKQIKEALLLIKDSVTIVQTQRPSSVQKKCADNVYLVPAALPETDDYFTSFVSAVDGEGGIWVQPVERDDPAYLEGLVEQMTQAYSAMAEEENVFENAQIGSVCAAPFEHDSSWYRVVVTSATSEEVVDVLYIDYGDSASINRSKLKILWPEFYRLPCQAVRCTLHAIIPTNGHWSSDALEIVDELTHCASWKPVMVKVMRHTHHSIAIIDTNTDQDINVAEQVVDKGFAVWVEHTVEPLPPFPPSINHPKEGVEAFNPLSIDHFSLPAGHFSAFVMSVHSLDLFYIMPTVCQESLGKLMEELSSVYSENDITPSCPAETDLVAVSIGEPVSWFRAKILSHSLKEEVLVHLLDYGANISLPLTRVHPLREEFFGPCFAIPCSLATMDTTWNGSAQLLESMSLKLCEWTRPGHWENTVLVEASINKDGQCCVLLFSPRKAISVNQQLLKECSIALQKETVLM